MGAEFQHAHRLACKGDVVVMPYVADVLEKHRGEDVVLVLRGVDGAAKGVAYGPGLAEYVLGGGAVGHVVFW